MGQDFQRSFHMYRRPLGARRTFQNVGVAIRILHCNLFLFIRCCKSQKCHKSRGSRTRLILQLEIKKVHAAAKLQDFIGLAVSAN